MFAREFSDVMSVFEYTDTWCQLHVPCAAQRKLGIAPLLRIRELASKGNAY